MPFTSWQSWAGSYKQQARTGKEFDTHSATCTTMSFAQRSPPVQSMTKSKSLSRKKKGRHIDRSPPPLPLNKQTSDSVGPGTPASTLGLQSQELSLLQAPSSKSAGSSLLDRKAPTALKRATKSAGTDLFGRLAFGLKNQVPNYRKKKKKKKQPPPREPSISSIHGRDTFLAPKPKSRMLVADHSEPSLASAAPSSPELRGRALRRRRGRASSLHQSIDETHVRQAARAKDQSNEVGSGSTKSPDATASLRISAVSQQLLEEVASREVCEPWLRAKLMLVGEGRAGKTSTKRTLLGLQFNPNEPSTVGADTTSVCQIDRDNVRNWSALDPTASSFSQGVVDFVARSQTSKLGSDEPQTKVSGNPKRTDLSDINHLDVVQFNSNGKIVTASPLSKAEAEQRSRRRRNITEKALSEMTEQLVAQLSDESESKHQQLKLSVWDFGGQEEFHDLHVLYLTRRGVYVCCFDLRRLAHASASSQQDALHNIRFWINSIRVHAPGAPVVLVGTHKDTVSTVDDHELVHNLLHRQLSLAGVRVVPNRTSSPGLLFFPVDNTQGARDPIVRSLRKAIEDAVIDDPAGYIFEELPLDWLRVLDVVEGKAGATRTKEAQYSRKRHGDGADQELKEPQQQATVDSPAPPAATFTPDHRRNTLPLMNELSLNVAVGHDLDTQSLFDQTLALPEGDIPDLDEESDADSNDDDSDADLNDDESDADLNDDESDSDLNDDESDALDVTQQIPSASGHPKRTLHEQTHHGARPQQNMLHMLSQDPKPRDPNSSLASWCQPISNFAEIVAAECLECSPAVCAAILEVFHENGSVLHFGNVPIVRDLVVTRPQALVDALCKVICGFNVHNRNRQLDALAAGLQHDWNTFEDSAIISQRLLDVLWAEYEPAVISFLVELMKSLSLLCDWREAPAPTPELPQHSRDASLFLVPSLLRKSELGSPEQFAPEAHLVHDHDSVGAVVKIAFKSTVDKQPLMPATMFPRVVCLCVEHSFAMPHQRMPPLVKHGQATLDLGGRDGIVTLSEGDNCLWIKLEAPDKAVVDIIQHKSEHVCSQILKGAIISEILVCNVDFPKGVEIGVAHHFCKQRDSRYKSLQVWFEVAFNNEDLPPALRDFVPLCDTASVKRLMNSPRLAAAERNAVAAIRRCDDSAVGVALASVATLAQSIGEEVRAAALARAQTPAILQICRRVQTAGDAHFRGVYESVWRTICRCDGIGCAEYSAAIAGLPLAAEAAVQTVSSPIDLLKHAACVKPRFAQFVTRIATGIPGIAVDLPDHLKALSRIIEKATLDPRASPTVRSAEAVDIADQGVVAGSVFAPRSVSRVFDVVRGMIICKNLRSAAVLVRRFRAAQAADEHRDNSPNAIHLVRVKERFFEAPSSGGWRDCMLCFYFQSDEHRHICEVQVVHRSLLTARKGLPGHAVYCRSRNAGEMVEFLLACKSSNSPLHSWSMSDAVRAGFLPPDLLASGFAVQNVASMLDESAEPVPESPRGELVGQACIATAKVPIKLNFEGRIRKLRLDQPMSRAAICEAIFLKRRAWSEYASYFQVDRSCNEVALEFSFTDEDGDRVAVTDADDFEEARLHFEHVGKKVVTLSVNVSTTTSSGSAADEPV